ncbi:hypothetical protein ANAEL_00867 [Anaerolineales bacterium]|nr:hypothetical protein ANAEL_00867 [Anaerolineales bacterium]
MSFPQKQIKGMKKEINAGGTDNVPPTLCPPPAHISACVPAYAERTGKAVTKKLNDMGPVRPMTVNGLISFSELRL